MNRSAKQSTAGDIQFNQITRPARTLLGWMAQQDAELVLVQRQINSVKAEHSERARKARAAVASRTQGLDQSDVVSEPPADLRDHVTRLLAHPSCAAFKAEGWTAKIADLSRVCALQPTVFWDHAEERAKDASASNLQSLINVTLPMPQEPLLPVQFDQHRNTWIIASRNPNLQIIGHHAGPVEGYFGCGFLITVRSSFLQVVLYRGRYVLRDGYHRALGLLAKGIVKVPSLYREFAEFEPLGIGPGMLPDEAFLGQRPPVLPDYLAPDVSEEVLLPASQKMVVVQGIELNPLG